MSSQWFELNAAEQATSLALTECCVPIDALSESSAIDAFYEHTRHVLVLGTPDALADSPTLGRLLLLGLVGTVELYLRSVITGVIRICPLAKAAASKQPIPYGAVAYYGMEGMEQGLFESISLADASTIKSRTDKLLAVNIPGSGSMAAALSEFENVCQLRHAVIHQHGTLNSVNVASLGFETAGGMRRVELTTSGVQSVAAVCQSAVRAYNRFLFRQIVDRWCITGTLTGTWATDKSLYEPLFALFRAREDDVGPKTAYISFVKLRPTLVKMVGSNTEAS